MLNWLTGNCELFGLSGQNWMLVVAGGLLAYIAVLALGRRRHVGLRQYSALATTLARVLDPASGRGLLHFIGRDHPRRLNAWIRRRIFPGAYPPTLAEVSRRVFEPAGMSVLHAENLRTHYARTLADWRARFEASERTVVAEFALGPPGAPPAMPGATDALVLPTLVG